MVNMLIGLLCLWASTGDVPANDVNHIINAPIVESVVEDNGGGLVVIINGRSSFPSITLQATPQKKDTALVKGVLMRKNGRIIERFRFLAPNTRTIDLSGLKGTFIFKAKMGNEHITHLIQL